LDHSSNDPTAGASAVPDATSDRQSPGRGSDVSSGLTCRERSDGYPSRAAHCQVTTTVPDRHRADDAVVGLGGYVVANAASLT
jgi:hypothetical protein